MSSSVSTQGYGAPIEKPPLSWPAVASMFKTTSAPKPAAPVVPSAPLIGANATLEQDKATVLRCWLAMGGEADTLRRKYLDEYKGTCLVRAYDRKKKKSFNTDKREWKMRDKPSDEVSDWCGVTVEGGRVTKLCWGFLGLKGAIPAEIGALSALTHLDLGHNKLNGAMPPTIGALSSLTELDLGGNYLSGVVPYHLSKLLNLYGFYLLGNNLSNVLDLTLSFAPTMALFNNHNGNTPRQKVQYFLTTTLLRNPTIRLLNYGIAITKKRQASLDRRISPRRATPPPNPFFAFLADHEHGITDLIMSFLDPCYCCNKDRSALLKCWNSLGRGRAERLRRGCGDDVSRWKGVTVKGGRVVKVNWGEMRLKGNLPSEIGELDGLRILFLFDNEISSIPSEIGKLTSLTKLDLRENHLADLPSELGNLRSLTWLWVDQNGLSALPPTLANLTNLRWLSFYSNNLTRVKEPLYNKEKVKTFLATLKS